MEINNGLCLGKFDLFKGVNPADQDHDFCIRHGLLEGYSNTIFAELCKVMDCARDEPMIWQKWVDISGRSVEVEVKEGGGGGYFSICNRLV